MTDKIQITANTEEWSYVINELAFMQTGRETLHITAAMEAVDAAVEAACPNWFAEDGQVIRDEDVEIELDEEMASLVCNVIEEMRS